MVKVVQEVNEKLGLKNDLLTVGQFNFTYIYFVKVPNLFTQIKTVTIISAFCKFYCSIVDDIVLMYVACGFETAWNKRSKSPWCSPISENNFKVTNILFIPFFTYTRQFKIKLKTSLTTQ